MMGYIYEEQRSLLFDDKGQRMFLQVRDRVQHLLKEAGAVRMQEAIRESLGDSWMMLACVDRLVELKEIQEVTPVSGRDRPQGQYRVFVSCREGEN